MNRILFIEPEKELANDFKDLGSLNDFETKFASTLKEAQNLLESFSPQLIVAEAHLSDGDFVHWLRQLRKAPQTKNALFIVLSDEENVEKRIHLIESGVDDFIQKPFEMEELLYRIRMLLREKDQLKQASPAEIRGFNGLLSEMNVVDLIQTFELGKKSGIITLSRGALEANLYIKEGMVWDAELGVLKGEAALYQIVLWTEGDFSAVFQPILREQGIFRSVQEIVQTSIQLLDEKEQLLTRLPLMGVVLEHVRDLFPDEINENTQEILSHVDAEHTIQDILDESLLDELTSLREIIRLYQLGVLRESISFHPPTQRESTSGETSTLEEEPLEENLIDRTFEAVQNFFTQITPAASEFSEDAGDGLPAEAQVQRMPRKLFFNRSELQFIKHKLL